MKQYIYGKNTVLEALKGDKNIFNVYLLKNMKDANVVDICHRKKITIEYVDKSFLNNLVQDVVHQGVVACIEEYLYYDVASIVRSIPKGKQPLLVMLDGLEDPHNLGAILRTCDAMGVDGVIIGKNRSVSLNATVAKVSTGAMDHIKVAKVTNLTRTLEELKQQSFWVVGCDLSKSSQDYRRVDYNMPLVLVIGSEGFGISRLVRQSCDMHVILPMVGHVTSLNASVATAVLLYQVYNSRHPL